MPTTKAYKIDWNYTSWHGPSDSPDNYPGATYYDDDIKEVTAQSPTNEVGYYKGRLFNSQNGKIEKRVLLVALDENSFPMLDHDMVVAKPCPPMCTDDGAGLPQAKPVQYNNIPKTII